MPRKSRRSRLAKSLRSHNATVFVSDKKPQEELDDPWCSDDDLVPVGSLLNDDDNDPDDMDDTTENTMCDSAQSGNVAVLIKAIEETNKLWRETGFNSGVRGYGTSKRTLQRNNAKAAKRIASGATSTGLVSWLSTKSTAAVEVQEDFSDTEVDDNEVEEGNQESAEVDYEEFTDIFDEILECQFEQTPRNDSPTASSGSEIPNRYTRREAISVLSGDAVTRNVRIEKKRGLEHYEVIQSMAIIRYLQLLTEGYSLMKASISVATVLYGKNARSSYKARSIRGWAKLYLQTGEIRKFQQGKNVKTASVITDEHIAHILRNYLRAMKDEDRCPKTFQELLNGSVLNDIPNAPRRISMKTATRWMYFLGFQPKKQRKGYYTDNHNRDDVVEYRDKVFLPTMQDYERRMVHYDGIDMTTEIIPNLQSEERPIVIITHDETTCYYCEGKAIMWMENGKNKLLPKTKGTSIIISGFACQCHGFFQKSMEGVTQQSFQFFQAGVGREGWFTNAHLVKHFEDLTPLIKEMHPNCDIVIGFDNSMTHHAKVYLQ